ncbi:CLIP domain-containing serine protease B9-like [Haliotis rufescens]|uniref:CLIP domain-containing serine protease B9-like n=1 Tax=Haliotis rufescens TaxID=6454 RepID=UPI001EB01B9A|nr:CLIP domain-containing serine protease B9-like [Haliotis rufescens]
MRILLVISLLFCICHCFLAQGVGELCKILTNLLHDADSQQLYDLLDCDKMLSSCGTVLNRKCPHPWVVIVRDKKRKAEMCVGTLIDERHIITAAHCFSQRYFLADDVHVGMGSQKAGQLTYIDLESFTLHPKYRNTGLARHDVAVLTLKKKVWFTPCIQPICIPGTATNPEKGELVTIVGFGRFWNKQRARLQATVLPVISREECVNIYPEVSALQHSICAGLWSSISSSSVCHGNSGAPMMLQREYKWFLYAVSTSHRSCEEAVSVYIDIPHYATWINSVKEHEQLS